MLYVMLFCEYPFERAEDAGDPHRFQKVRVGSLEYLCEAPAAQNRVTLQYGCSNARQVSEWTHLLVCMSNTPSDESGSTMQAQQLSDSHQP